MGPVGRGPKLWGCAVGPKAPEVGFSVSLMSWTGWPWGLTPPIKNLLIKDAPEPFGGRNEPNGP